MHDADLDQLLQRTRPSAPDPATVAAARDLADQVRRGAPRRPPGRRRPAPRVAVTALAGALLLTGGTTLAAHQLRVPPFQTVPDGIQRLEEPVPLDFVEPDGTERRCLVYLELTGVDRADLDRLEDEIASRSWSAAEQQAVTGLASPRSQDELTGGATGDGLFRLAHATIPGLRLRGDEGPRYAGYAATCRPDAR